MGQTFKIPLEVGTGAVLALQTQPQVQTCQVWRVNVKIGKDCQRELRNKVWNFGRGNIHIGIMMFVIKTRVIKTFKMGGMSKK